MTPPLHTLTTARLSLHDLVSEADYRACYAMDCDPMVVRYVGTGEAEKRPFEEYRDFMRGRLALWTSERFHMWAMCLHGSDEFLGRSRDFIGRLAAACEGTASTMKSASLSACS